MWPPRGILLGPIMADRIELTGLVAYGYHGVLPEEKKNGQTFTVDITAWLDFHEAARDDDLTKTINYAELAELAHDVVTGPSKNLVETVASEIADLVLENYDQLHAVEVTVHKPHAPIPIPFSDVAVVARRNRAKNRRG